MVNLKFEDDVLKTKKKIFVNQNPILLVILRGWV
jgi:hypothetical protein